VARDPSKEMIKKTNRKQYQIESENGKMFIAGEVSTITNRIDIGARAAISREE
jgi:hypothetical protein